MIVPVILSGGSGSRLWPLSRELFPKQFLPLVGEETMLQSTLTRLAGLPELAAPLVVCNEEHRFLVAEQLRALEVDAATIILEPVGRNTAPAVAVAALQALSGGDDPLLLILPADHVIRDPAALREAITTLLPLAADGKLATLGIVPTAPETGYGYIKGGKGGVSAVERFVEKPDRATAERYLASGDYYWNSGMFFFRASRVVAELERHAPDILASCRKALQGSRRDCDFIRLDSELFSGCRSDSFDYAVMEKTDAAVVMPLAAGWSDVGSWAALWEVGERDESGNVKHGDVMVRDSHDCYLHAGQRLVAAVGVRDLVVVETADAVLVVPRERAQEVKQIVEELKATQRCEALLNRRVHRPWGSYIGIDCEDRFQVKRITVNPGARLSLQKHHHRAEHWIVVKGTAQITCGEKSFVLGENQSTYIPLGEVHRLENPGVIPLELIEVQSGSYLGEDDIVRFDDQYGR